MNKWFVYDAGDFLKGFKTEQEANDYIDLLYAEDLADDSYLYVVDIEEHRDIQDGEEDE